MSIARTFLSVMSLSMALVAASGCSPSTSDIVEHTNATEEPIIGGVAVTAASMNAVGSLVTISRWPSYGDGGVVDSYSSPFCTATLVGPRAVITAKHCVQSVSSADDVGFAIGPDGRKPLRVVPVVAIETESTVTGGFIKMGSDVAILHLATSVDDIAPFAIGTLAPEDVGSRFVTVGYGMQDSVGTLGTRRAGSLTFKGTEGKVFEFAFGSYEGFKAMIPKIGDVSYLVGDVTTPDGDKRARDLYDTRTLLKGYEAFTGASAGDAQACHGDSGGPLLRKVNGKNTVFGVTSWGHHSSGYFCEYGSIFAAFGPKTTDFITSALAWKDPCPDISWSGRCEGDVAVRCSGRNEGSRRLLKTDCAAVGLSCGAGPDGQAACIDR